MRLLVLVAALALSSQGTACGRGSEQARDRPADSTRWVVGYVSMGGDTARFDSETVVRVTTSSYEAWWVYRYSILNNRPDDYETARVKLFRMESDCAVLRTRVLESEYRNGLGATVGLVHSRNDLVQSAEELWRTVRPQSEEEAMLRSFCDRVRGANLPIVEPSRE
jgi:hypothetical protein